MAAKGTKKPAQFHGVSGYHEYFSLIYNERWPTLFAALQRPVKQIALINPFVNIDFVEEHLRGTQECTSAELYGCREIPEQEPATASVSEELPKLPLPIQDPRSKLLTHYLMDGASLVAARALNARPGEHVLDLCAAPGGKSLAILFDILFPKPQHEPHISTANLSAVMPRECPQTPSENANASNSLDSDSDSDDDNNSPMPPLSLQKRGVLISNEPSGPRRRRLEAVFKEYLPMKAGGSVSSASATGPAGGAVARQQPIVEVTVRITAHDGEQWGTQNAERGRKYDRILVDAPCSSDRHVILTHPEEFSQWSLARIRNNAARQVSLLTAALSACRPQGGRVVYSTCALSPIENDEVIEKAMSMVCSPRKASSSKSGGMKHNVRVLQLPEFSIPFGEPTKYGFMILPDKPHGYGPMYICVLESL